MKSLKQILWIGGWLCLAASPGLAQTNPVNTASQPKREGQVLVPERLTANDANVTATANVRPTRPERPGLPNAVLTPVERFKNEARAYLAREQELKKNLEGANDKDRALIRERIKALREQWAERARELRKEFKERRDEVSAKLPDRQELFNSIRDNAPQTLQSDDGHTRPRRGD